jgi:hypothetical protein
VRRNIDVVHTSGSKFTPNSTPSVLRMLDMTFPEWIRAFGNVLGSSRGRLWRYKVGARIHLILDSLHFLNTFKPSKNSSAFAQDLFAIPSSHQHYQVTTPNHWYIGSTHIPGTLSVATNSSNNINHGFHRSRSTTIGKANIRRRCQLDRVCPISRCEMSHAFVS